MNVALIFLLTFNSPVLRPEDKSKSIQTTTLHSLDCKSNSSIVTNSSHNSSPSPNSTCEFCIKIVDVIEKYSNLPNATIYDIIKVIEDVCSKIHNPQGKECFYIVKKIEEILNWINEGLVPKKICGLLGLCPQKGILKLNLN